MLSRLIARCLEKQPDDRVQTARDIHNELRHIQKQLESGSRTRLDSGSAQAAVDDSLWLAVLPFTRRGTDPEDDTLAAGPTEDITARLRSGWWSFEVASLRNHANLRRLVPLPRLIDWRAAAPIV